MTGVAVAVTDIPGTDAVALRAPHAAGSTHNHVGTNTSCADGGAGLTRIVGGGIRSSFTASCTNNICPGGLPKIRTRINGDTPVRTSPHQPTYHACGGGNGPNVLTRSAPAGL